MKRKKVETQNGRGEDGKEEGKKKEIKAKQVLIGERPSSECQRYLLSQRGLRCEARLSRGPQRCEVITGKKTEKFRWRDTGRKTDTGRE